MHLMLDLETLSLRMNAVLMEFGWCTFEPTQPGLIIDSKSLPLDWPEQIGHRHINGDTIKWWLQQDKAAQDTVTRAEKTYSLDEMVEELRALPWENIEGVWSHGANFDIAIIGELFADKFIKVPWDYRSTRDTRTIFWLAGMKNEDLEKAEIKHSAMHDAIAQAKSVQKAMKIITEKF